MFRVYNVDGEAIFEVGGDVTPDLAEAVALAMRDRVGGEFWDLRTADLGRTVSPERCLYWLSGGDKEWSPLEHYLHPWFTCCGDFCAKWGRDVADIVDKSATLGEVRDGFRDRLNLHVIYDWCVGRGHIR